MALTPHPPSSKRLGLRKERRRPGPPGETGRVGMDFAYKDGTTVRQVIFDYVSDEVSTATVDYWYVDEGSTVEAGDDLCELRTEDGGLFTISSPVDGILRERFFEQGDEVEVGDVVATIDDGIDDIEEEEEEEEEEDEEEEEKEEKEGVDDEEF
jgi:pyruvate/2-oxoglutarate dehydrogenase complex dihydrolipoamide acyltransferase (E2) component